MPRGFPCQAHPLISLNQRSEAIGSGMASSPSGPARTCSWTNGLWHWAELSGHFSAGLGCCPACDPPKFVSPSAPAAPILCLPSYPAPPSARPPNGPTPMQPPLTRAGTQLLDLRPRIFDPLTSKFRPPDLEISTPDLEILTSDLEISTPDLEYSTSDLENSTP